MVKRRWLLSLLPVASIVFTISAQFHATYRREEVGKIALFWAAGLAAYILLLRLLPGTPPRSPLTHVASLPVAKARLPLLGLCCGLALIAWTASADNRFTTIGVLSWLGSCLTFLAAFWSWQGVPRFDFRDGLQRMRRGLTLPVSRELLLLCLLLGVATTARLYRLPTVPPEMNSDHVEKLLDVYDVLNGQYRIFFEHNTGREPMQFYLIAAISRLFGTGLTFLSLKLSNVVMGVVAVVGTYLLGREIGGAKLGFLAGFFVAVSMWAVATSRIGLRYPFAPAFTSLSLWALLRALRTSHINHWLVGGTLLGAGLYGYTAFRIMPVVAVVTVALKLVGDFRDGRRLSRRTLYGFGVYVAVATLVFLPLGRYMVESPNTFWYRALTRTTSLERTVETAAWQTASQTVLRTLGMFNWVGDEVWVVALRKVPVLDVVSGGLFILGLMYTLLVLSRQRSFLAAVLVVDGLLLLSPSALNVAFPRESPSVVRAGGAIPVVAVLIALGVWYLYKRMNELAGSRRVGTALVAVLLMGMMLLNYQRYFGPYLTQYYQSAMNSVEVADRMRDYLSLVGDTEHMALKGRPHWLDARSLGIQLESVDWDKTHASLELAPLVAAAPKDGRPLLFVVHPADVMALIELKAAYQNGVAITYPSRAPNHDYVFFVVPTSENFRQPAQ